MRILTETPNQCLGSLGLVRCNTEAANSTSFFAWSYCLEGNYVPLTQGCPSSQKAALTPVFVQSQPLCTESTGNRAQLGALRLA